MDGKIEQLIFRLSSWAEYFTKAQSNHYLHSPFVFQLYQYLHSTTFDNEIKSVENYRTKLASNNENLILTEAGAGQEGKFNATISKRYRKTSVDKRFGKILFLLAKKYCGNILELGTSMGVSSAYLAAASTSNKVFTLDINPLPKFCIENLTSFSIYQTVGKFEDTLAPTLEKIGEIPLAFVDGNHTYKATLGNTMKILPFMAKNSCIVLHDIRYSREMNQAWKELGLNEAFNYCLDFGEFGLLIKSDNQSPRQYFYLRR